MSWKYCGFYRVLLGYIHTHATNLYSIEEQKIANVLQCWIWQRANSAANLPCVCREWRSGCCGTEHRAVPPSTLPTVHRDHGKSAVRLTCSETPQLPMLHTFTTTDHSHTLDASDSFTTYGTIQCVLIDWLKFPNICPTLQYSSPHGSGQHK